MVAIAVLSALVAVAIPGYQAWLIVFGGVLIAWATFGLLRERPDAAWRTLGISRGVTRALS